MAEIKLQVKNLTKIFPAKNKKENTVTALSDINLEVRESEFVVIVGPSGCGKSTLLNIIGGLEEATEGEVWLEGKVVCEPGADRGMVFQGYSLFPWLTVQKNVEFGLKMKRLPAKEQSRIAGEYIKMVGLSGFENALPKQLSGGMKRKLMVCRALLTDPEILLLDEPTVGMDAFARRQMWDLLRRLNQQKLTILLTTHYIEEAQMLCQRVAMMEKGRILQVDTPAGFIRRLGDYAVDEILPTGTHTSFFSTKEEALAYAGSISGNFHLRETVLEDVFINQSLHATRA